MSGTGNRPSSSAWDPRHRAPSFFVEFHLPQPLVEYISTFTTRPALWVARDFLADALAESLPLLLPVPSCVVVGCFAAWDREYVTLVFSVSATDLTSQALCSLLVVVLDDWTGYLGTLYGQSLPASAEPPLPSLDLALVELTSLILLPTSAGDLARLA